VEHRVHTRGVVPSAASIPATMPASILSETGQGAQTGKMQLARL